MNWRLIQTNDSWTEKFCIRDSTGSFTIYFTISYIWYMSSMLMSPRTFSDLNLVTSAVTSARFMMNSVNCTALCRQIYLIAFRWIENFQFFKESTIIEIIIIPIVFSEEVSSGYPHVPHKLVPDDNAMVLDGREHKEEHFNRQDIGN